MQDQALYDAANYLLSRAKELGADAADCACNKSMSLGVAVRLGKLENVEREEARSAGLRIIIGKQQAGASTSALNKEALDILANRVVSMARAAAEDPYCGIASEANIETNIRNLEIEDNCEPDLAWLEERALECEAAALEVKGVTNIAGCGSSWGKSEVVYGATNGFIGGYGGTSWSLGVAALAGEGDDKERDYAGHSARFKPLLRGAKLIGIEAGERAVARLGSRKIASIKAPVILEARVARSIMGYLIGAISGTAIARGVSFLRDKLGQQIFAQNINIIDDPFKLGGWGSKPFDGEGVKVSKQSIIENGTLTNWLLNTSTALQLGLATNGHASMNQGGSAGIGVSNFVLQPSNLSQDDLIKQMGNGLFIIEAMSPSFNPNTGDYSVGVAGIEIINGEKAGAISEITIAGNMTQIFASLIPANDLEGKSAIDCPSLLIDGMTIAGS